MNKRTLVSYDSDADVLYIVTKRGIEATTVEISPGINVELDEKGKVIGIEILRASKVLRPVARPLYHHLQSAGV